MAVVLNKFKVALQLLATVNEVRDGVNANAPGGSEFAPVILTSGTTANQADRSMQDKARTLTSGNSENIDIYDFAGINLGAGAGRDLIGTNITLAEIVGIMIVNQTVSAGVLKVGGEGSAAAWNSIFDGSDTSKSSIGPGGCLFYYDPNDPAFAVVDATNHLLKFEASGGNVTYDFALLGRSA